MSVNIGDLVKINKGAGKGEIGIVLDYLIPFDLTIKLSCGRTINKDYQRVEKLGENND